MSSAVSCPSWAVALNLMTSFCSLDLKSRPTLVMETAFMLILCGFMSPDFFSSSSPAARSGGLAAFPGSLPVLGTGGLAPTALSLGVGCLGREETTCFSPANRAKEKPFPHAASRFSSASAWIPRVLKQSADELRVSMSWELRSEPRYRNSSRKGWSSCPKMGMGGGRGSASRVTRTTVLLWAAGVRVPAGRF